MKTNGEKRNSVSETESDSSGGFALGRAGNEAGQVVVKRNPDELLLQFSSWNVLPRVERWKIY